MHATERQWARTKGAPTITQLPQVLSSTSTNFLYQTSVCDLSRRKEGVGIAYSSCRSTLIASCVLHRPTPATSVDTRASNMLYCSEGDALRYAKSCFQRECLGRLNLLPCSEGRCDAICSAVCSLSLVGSCIICRSSCADGEDFDSIQT